MGTGVTIRINNKTFLLDLLFPRRCVVCDEIAEWGNEGICNRCREKIIYIKPPFCLKCGRQLRNEGEHCTYCEHKKLPYKQSMALYDYGSMADSIFRFKYGNRQEYALFYARDFLEKRGGWLRFLNPDALVPVPVHRTRRRKRGYNQAELIAREIGKLSGIPVNTRLVARVKRTLPQKNLSDEERQNNLKKAFKILQNDVKLNTIVIVDDIYTTGSTVSAVTEVLLEAGVRNVYVMALAIGRG